jgi:5-methylcytosine-specific restriction endonuclease McrA
MVVAQHVSGGEAMKNTFYNSRGGSRAWRRLRARVLAEQPSCQIRLPGCTGRSEVADHIIPKRYRPDLVLRRENVQGACRACNSRKGSRTRAQAGAARRGVAARNAGQQKARALSFFD